MVFAQIMQAQTKGRDYTVDNNRNVIISKVVENIPLHQNAIYMIAHRYMEEAYQETKYKITFESEHYETIIGEGTYEAFHEANYFPYSYFLNAPFQLRVDAKDGRARISIILSYYTGKRININETTDIHDRICEFPPVNSSSSEHDKLYKKGFAILVEKAHHTLDDVINTISNTPANNSLETDW